MQSHATHDYVAAPAWSLFLGQAGKSLIIAAAGLFLLSIIFWSRSSKNERFAIFGKLCFTFGSTAVLGAFASLVALFATDQFQFEYVQSHSIRDMAMKYKVAAVWSGQQGSFLLWATCSTIFGLLVMRGTGPYRKWFTVTYSCFLAAICGILSYETPFNIIPDAIMNGIVRVPQDGQGLVPSLQNYWVVIHPPTIFLGFGSLTVMFAYAVAAMATGRLREWTSYVRPWTLVSLAILGLGLCMGGFWAYETLGWGGFWAWDPVENVSLVPWLFTAAFIHGVIVQTTRGRWVGSNLLLGGLPFLLFVYGTFLTRSGFLSEFSVHSFAEMNRSALWILLSFFLAATVGFIVLWATRGRRLVRDLDEPTKAEGYSREAGYQTGIMLLSGLATAVAIGMSIPFFLGLFNQRAKVVEEGLYHNVIVWFFIPIMLLIGGVPFLSWRTMKKADFWNKMMTILGITFFLAGLTVLGFYFSDWMLHADMGARIDFPFGIKVSRFWWTIALSMTAIFAAVANLWRMLETFKRSKMGIGGFLSHFGLATALAGLILSRGLERKEQLIVMSNSPAHGLGYEVSYKKMTSNPENDRENKVLFNVRSITGKDSYTFEARPGFFFTPGQNGLQAFTWPHVQRELTHDVYFALGAPQFTLWEQPVTLKPGETHTDDRGEFKISVTYVEMVRKGEPGQPGSSFGAKLKIVENDKVYWAEPKIVVGEGPDLVEATPNFFATLMGMNAADQSVNVQLPFTSILYPVELFYKPLTGLVWAGTGILTLGGLLSAFYRRRRVRAETPASEPTSQGVDKEEDATLATAQS